MVQKAAAKGTLMSITGNWNKGARSGFTLFELLVVMVILIITAVFVVPSFEDESSEGVTTAIHLVRQAVVQGRTLAKLTRGNVLVEFKPSLIRVGGKDELEFPGSTRFLELILAGEDKDNSSELLVNRRGIVPLAIVRVETDDQLYSLLVSPVLNDVEYRSGVADFSDFAE